MVWKLSENLWRNAACMACGAVLAVALTTNSVAVAQDGSGAASGSEVAISAVGSDVGSEAASGSAEAAHEDPLAKLDTVMTTSQFTPQNPGKDPFKPLVQKKPQQVVVVQQQTEKKPEPKPEPSIPPIKVTVLGICGNESERLAMITFDNKFLTVGKGQDVDGKFKVVEINTDQLVIFSNREKIRRSFKVGTGE